MKKTFFIAFIFASFLLAGCQKSVTPEQICTYNKGKWLPEYNECEYLAKDICEANGGVFKECESACRNDQEAQMCTAQCVIVCDFGGKKKIEEIKLDARNTSYLIDGKKIALVNGHSETEIFPGSASKNITDVFSADTKGDFDRDGVEDTAVLLTQNNGGSGTFFYIAVFNGKKGSNAILLNDRISPQTIEFQEGKIIVNYADRFPWDNFSVQPSLGKSKYLQFAGETLTATKKFPRFTEEIAEKLVKEKWGDCTDRCKTMTIKRFDGREQVWFVGAIYDEMLDDSIKTVKYIAMANYAKDQWVLGETIMTSYKCREGRGQADFGPELCK